MPERMVKPDILTDEAVDRLSSDAEVFYRRLISVVDDFGRYDGRLTVLLAHLYPLKMRIVSESEIEKWLAECANAGVLLRYVIDGKPFIAFTVFDQRLRAKKSKWPAPLTSDDIRQQMPTNASKCPQMPANAANTETEASTDTEPKANTEGESDARTREEPPDESRKVPAQENPPLPENKPVRDPMAELENRQQFSALEVETMGRAILAACGMKSPGWQDDGKAKGIGMRRLQEGDTLTDIADFANGRKKTPVLNYFEQDFLAWKADREKVEEPPEPAPLRLVGKMPEGLSPGEQRRWAQSQIDEQKAQRQRTA